MRVFRLIQIPLALITFLAWAAPSGAVDLSKWTSWQTGPVQCLPAGFGGCSGTYNLPMSGTVLVQYVSVSCTFGNDDYLVSLDISGLPNFNAFLNVPAAVKVAGGKEADGSQLLTLYESGGPDTQLSFTGQTAPITGPGPSCMFWLFGQRSPPTGN